MIPIIIPSFEAVKLPSVKVHCPTPDLLNAVEIRPIRDFEDDVDALSLTEELNCLGGVDPAVVPEDGEGHVRRAFRLKVGQEGGDISSVESPALCHLVVDKASFCACGAHDNDVLVLEESARVLNIISLGGPLRSLALLGREHALVDGEDLVAS